MDKYTPLIFIKTEGEKYETINKTESFFMDRYI